MFKIQLGIFAIVFLPFASQYTQFTDLQAYTLYMHKTYTHYVHMYKEKLGQDRSACYYESLVCWEIWFSWLLLIAGCLLYLKMYPWICLSVGAQDSWGDYLKKNRSLSCSCVHFHWWCSANLFPETTVLPKPRLPQFCSQQFLSL